MIKSALNIRMEGEDILHIPAVSCRLCNGSHCALVGAEKSHRSISLRIDDANGLGNRCALLANAAELSQVLRKLSESGCLLLSIRGKGLRKRIDPAVRKIQSSFTTHEFLSSNDGNELFPAENPFALYYFYSYYYPKSSAVRSILYLAAWCGLQGLLRRWMAQQSVIAICDKR